MHFNRQLDDGELSQFTSVSILASGLNLRDFRIAHQM